MNNKVFLRYGSRQVITPAESGNIHGNVNPTQNATINFIYLFKRNKLYTIWILILWLNSNLYSQNYIDILSKKDKEILFEKKHNNIGLSEFIFNIDTSLAVHMGYLDSLLSYEFLSINSKVEGIKFTYNKNSLWKISSFKNNSLDGIEYELNENGSIKSFGNWKCINADTSFIINNLIVDPNTGENIENIVRYNFFSYKDGMWLYYNSNHVLIKKEFWCNGKNAK